MWRIFVSAMMMLLLLVGVAGAQEVSQGYQIKENQINSE